MEYVLETSLEGHRNAIYAGRIRELKIFVANTGRCGSAFMASAFGRLTNIPSFHEPSPKGIGQVLKEVNEDCISSRTQKILHWKIEAIKKNATDGDYCETSQMFIKTFVDGILNNFDDVYCIYLWRNPIDVTLSYMKWWPNFPSHWLLLPHWKKNAIRLSGSLSWFELLLFNWFEIRERFLKYRNRFVKTYEFDFRRIDRLDEYLKMFRHFGIQWNGNADLGGIEKNEGPEKNPSELLKQINKSWSKPYRTGGAMVDYEAHEKYLLNNKNRP